MSVPFRLIEYSRGVLARCVDIFNNDIEGRTRDLVPNPSEFIPAVLSGELSGALEEVERDKILHATHEHGHGDINRDILVSLVNSSQLVALRPLEPKDHMEAAFMMVALDKHVTWQQAPGDFRLKRGHTMDMLKADLERYRKRSKRFIDEDGHIWEIIHRGLPEVERAIGKGFGHSDPEE